MLKLTHLEDGSDWTGARPRRFERVVYVDPSRVVTVEQHYAGNGSLLIGEDGHGIACVKESAAEVARMVADLDPLRVKINELADKLNGMANCDVNFIVCPVCGHRETVPTDPNDVRDILLHSAIAEDMGLRPNPSEAEARP